MMVKVGAAMVGLAMGASLVMAAETGSKLHSGAARRPNLVFVFSDQQSWDMMGAYGNTNIVTPNFDRLAAQGVRFNHCISSAPVCTPYRGMLLSGQHPLRTGALENDFQMRPGKGQYFGEVLRDAGYRTGYYGKWHLYGGGRARPIPPGPYRYGFDHEFLSNNCTLDYSPETSYYWDDDGKKQRYGDWEQYAQTRQAIEFVEKHADKPFALFLSWHPPHNWKKGYDAPPDCMALYDANKLRGVRRANLGHMALVTSIDKAFGWLMEELKKKGLEDNTIVVFTSDHGDVLGATPHNKLRPEQESIRVPLLLRYPVLLKPRVSELLLGTLDLMPTLLSMMKLPVPKTCDGQDLSGVIAKGDDDAVDSVPLIMPWMDYRGVYTRRYTYSYDTAESNATLSAFRKQFFPPARFTWNVLYDRQNDPFEKKNLYGDPQYKEIQEQLHAQTRKWMELFGDAGLPYHKILELNRP
jgi:arylsulfatase A-like enzyme